MLLQRTRSASLPRDLGEGYFLSEADFHSDVYDDTKEEEEIIVKESKIENEKKEIRIDELEQQHDHHFQVIFKVIIMIISGAISSILYEMMLKIDKNSSLLAAFILHFWIVLFSIPNLFQYLFSPKIPIYYHLLIVFFSFTFLYLKSIAIKILPMPIIIVCSNMQLVLGLFIGKFFFLKSFNNQQYFSIVIITFGCCLITIISQDTLTSNLSFLELIQGLGYILTAILSLTIMIPIGSLIIQKYNANINEQIFYQHFLSFPLFFLQWNQIQPSINQLIPFQTTSQIIISSQQINPSIQFYSISIPIVLMLLISTTVFAQLNRYLTMEISLSLSPLLSQLLNTINKTIVLLVSMIYFNSPPYPTLLIWVGVIIQTIGSILYVQSSIAPSSSSSPSSTTTSQSQSTKSSFQVNPRKSRFSRCSITGKRLGISEVDLKRLKQLADQSNIERKKHESNQESHENQDDSNFKETNTIGI